jgi:hypothetical protein
MLVGRLLATGRPGAQKFRSTAAADIETEKALSSLMLSVAGSPRVLHADEVPRGSSISGETITAAITATDGEMTVRKLGVSESIQVAGVIVSACGNNTTASNDLARRMLTINLSFTGGQVIARTGFRHPDLAQYVRDNRPALFGAAQTVLLYAIQNNPVREIPRLGFSHNWAPFILGAMSHFRTEDDSADMAELALRGWFNEVDAGSETADDWGEAVHVLWRRLGGEAELSARVLQHLLRPDPLEGPFDLPEAVKSLKQFDERAQVKELTKALGAIRGMGIAHEGVVYRVMKRSQSANSKKSVRWYVEAIDENGELIQPGDAQPVPAEVFVEADFS